jgi:ABC-type branched-subunit amino acid transport system substrate-binding protein
MRTKLFKFLALLLPLLLVAAACGGDDDDSASGDKSPGTTAASGETGAYKVDTSDCPDDVNDPITGTIKIGSTMPLSGGVAAVAFAPVAEGLKNYIAYANDNNLVPGHKLELKIEDDQYNATLTTPAVEKLLDETKVNLFTSMIGTPNNLAVRDTLNEECYPQLFAASGAPAFGDVAKYPWTMGGLAPYNTETLVYIQDIQKTFPDGAKVAIHHVNSEFGDYYAKTLKAHAKDAKITVVTDQTIEAEDANPPTAQVTEIASKKPDVILAVPLGAQCPTFLSELAKAKAANPGWNPRLYITSTCASPLILSIAGAAANGLITISGALDVADPKNADNPKVKAYKDYMVSKGFKADGDFATAAAGWAGGESTVAVLAAAAKSGDITRASIINAARNLDFTPSLFRDGVKLKTDGEKDGFPLESFQVIQWNADSKTYTDLGSLVTSFEGKTVVE